MAGQTDFTLERAKEVREIVEDMYRGLPKARKLDYIGHLNDILLFIGAAEKRMRGSEHQGEGL